MSKSKDTKKTEKKKSQKTAKEKKQAKQEKKKNKQPGGSVSMRAAETDLESGKFFVISMRPHCLRLKLNITTTYSNGSRSFI